MSLLGNRRRKKSRTFEILVIPQSDGGGTKSFKGSKLALWGGALLVGLFFVFVLSFRYTPLGRLVGVKEEITDSAGVVTERRIRALAEEMAVLKEYNMTLRRALGERSEKASAFSNVEEKKEEPSPQQRRQELPNSVPEDFASPAPARHASVSGENATVASVEVLKASFPLFTPVSGIVTQGFEPDNKHYGVDYAAKIGTPVHAAAQGYVVFAGWTHDYGNMLIVSHGGGYITVYKHSASLLKNTGALVKRGELICLVGDTGLTSKGPHLHFEVLKDGVPLDPMQLLLISKLSL
jgi:murein DD-endopeptidase MepM/ murein hydrolase activator NlpD